jgi:single-stranded DNA-binding protein
MAINNTVILTGNLGAEADIIETENTTFAAIRLATTDSYKNEETGKWEELDTIWHNLIAFNPRVIEVLKSLKTGTRIEVTGSLSYRPYKVMSNGKEITKKEASVIIRKVEMAPLPKKG